MTVARILGIGALGLVGIAAAGYGFVQAKLAAARRQPRLEPESLIQSPEEFEGWLELQGAVNLRDAGGYRTTDGKQVKRGLLYRSGALAGLSDGALLDLEKLGIRQVFDLRISDEVALAPDRIPAGAEYIHLPVNTTQNRWSRLGTLINHLDRMERLHLASYTGLMVEQNPQVFGELFKRLAADEGMPAIIHCTAGKDRTGMSVALLLSMLGVSDDTIAADYSLSNRFYSAYYEATLPQLRPIRRLGVKIDDMHVLLLAPPAMLREALAYVRERYGSVEAYLRDYAGITAETITKLREKLLTE